jgi:hypothetical protein
MKRLPLCLLLASLASPRDSLSWYDRAIEFESHWDKAVRLAFGCPLTGDTPKGSCHLNKGLIDYRELRLSRKAAEKLFDLHE